MSGPTKEKVLFITLGIPMVICLLAFFWIAYLLSTGVGTLNWKLLTTSVLQGGIFEMIVGTMYLLLGAAGIAGPIGVLAAIYLVEYAPSGRLTRIIDQSINNLAGVPSIVIGLFGYTFFLQTTRIGNIPSRWLANLSFDDASNSHKRNRRSNQNGSGLL